MRGREEGRVKVNIRLEPRGVGVVVRVEALPSAMKVLEG